MGYTKPILLNPAFSVLSAAGVVTNRIRTPNAVSLVQATYVVVGEAVSLVMDKYHWEHLAIISDKLTRLQEGGRSTSECDGVLVDMRKRASEIHSSVVDVDSTNPGFSFVPALTKSKAFSRSEYTGIWHVKRL